MIRTAGKIHRHIRKRLASFRRCVIRTAVSIVSHTISRVAPKLDFARQTGWERQLFGREPSRTRQILAVWQTDNFRALSKLHGWERVGFRFSVRRTSIGLGVYGSREQQDNADSTHSILPEIAFQN